MTVRPLSLSQDTGPPTPSFLARHHLSFEDVDDLVGAEDPRERTSGAIPETRGEERIRRLAQLDRAGNWRACLTDLGGGACFDDARVEVALLGEALSTGGFTHWFPRVFTLRASRDGGLGNFQPSSIVGSRRERRGQGPQRCGKPAAPHSRLLLPGYARQPVSPVSCDDSSTLCDLSALCEPCVCSSWQVAGARIDSPGRVPIPVNDDHRPPSWVAGAWPENTARRREVSSAPSFNSPFPRRSQSSVANTACQMPRP